MRPVHNASAVKIACASDLSGSGRGLNHQLTSVVESSSHRLILEER